MSFADPPRQPLAAMLIRLHSGHTALASASASASANKAAA